MIACHCCSSFKLDGFYTKPRTRNEDARAHVNVMCVRVRINPIYYINALQQHDKRGMRQTGALGRRIGGGGVCDAIWNSLHSRMRPSVCVRACFRVSGWACPTGAIVGSVIITHHVCVYERLSRNTDGSEQRLVDVNRNRTEQSMVAGIEHRAPRWCCGGLSHRHTHTHLLYAKEGDIVTGEMSDLTAPQTHPFYKQWCQLKFATAINNGACNGEALWKWIRVVWHTFV